MYLANTDILKLSPAGSEIPISYISFSVVFISPNYLWLTGYLLCYDEVLYLQSVLMVHCLTNKEMGIIKLRGV